MAISGGCRRSQCRYSLDYPSIPATYACHCLDCQTMSGVAFVIQALVPLSRFTIVGERIEWSHPNPQGNVTTQSFCDVCKTRLYSTNEGRPGLVLVRAGTFDDSLTAIPAVHMWIKRKQLWIGLPTDAEFYDESVPSDRGAAIFAPNFAETN
jgi:hypothetical protein